MDGIAKGVAEYLNFDMTGIDDRALQDHRGAAEPALRLGARAAQSIKESCCIRDEPHAAPATAGNGLDHHGEADPLGLGQHRAFALVRALITGHAGHAGGLHDLLGAGLVAHRLDGFRRRPNERQTCIKAGLRKILILGEKAIARVNRIRAT